ncbi:MAG: class II SORL domain-containing protein [Candidatus Aminicenantaceae bacterium]
MCKDDIFCGINKAKTANVDDMTDLEKKHTPVIEAPEKVKKSEPFEVYVEVGRYMKHPNENAHFIEWIELFSGDTFLARVDLVPRLTEPRVKFVVSLDHSHPLIAKERCNLHGLWESASVEIQVEE